MRKGLFSIKGGKIKESSYQSQFHRPTKVGYHTPEELAFMGQTVLF